MGELNTVKQGGDIVQVKDATVESIRHQTRMEKDMRVIENDSEEQRIDRLKV